jgi:hypothetical protein
MMSRLKGEKYKNNDPDSEEEIWIPIKTKVKGQLELTKFHK